MESQFDPTIASVEERVSASRKTGLVMQGTPDTVKTGLVQSGSMKTPTNFGYGSKVVRSMPDKHKEYRSVSRERARFLEGADLSHLKCTDQPSRFKA